MNARMKWIGLYAAFLSATLTYNVHATETVPIIVVIDQGPHFDAGRANSAPYGGVVGSLIASWANASVDKKSAAQASALRDALPNVNFAALAATAFQCFGRAEQAQSCVP